VVVGGGVACNRGLRAGLAEGCARLGIPAVFPAPRWCTDNAAMIAVVGTRMWERGLVAGPELEPVASLEETGFGLPAVGRAS
jgi:N6-L-threonylcarbamoyladenine synthase